MCCKEKLKDKKMSEDFVDPNASKNSMQLLEAEGPKEC